MQSEEMKGMGITNLNRAFALVVMLGLSAPAAGDAAEGGDAQSNQKPGPLAALPSPPGPHIEKIKALGDNQWLDLGSPAADDKWGKARGRSWSSNMPGAAELGGAFVFGEGVHGFAKPDGHYMNDLWFYDINAPRGFVSIRASR
jgi:hypothetical protein